MKKIAIFISDITKSAGTERAVCNLANILISLNYKPYIISTNSSSGTAYYNLKDEVNVIHLNVNLNNTGLRKIVSYIQFFNYLIKNKEKFDYYIGTFFTFNLLISFCSRNIKTIGCEHFNYLHANFIQRFLRKIFYKQLSAVVVLTKRDAEHYSFIDQKKLFIIPNSLSFLPVSHEDYNTKVIISIGRLSYQKGFDRLIDIVNKKKSFLSDWKVLIIGSGELKDELIAQINKFELNDIISILPPTHDVISLYNSACIYAMTSHFEGLPMVLIESQACGLPIISFDCPEGPSEVVQDGNNGFLIENDNIDLFAEKLCELIVNNELREKFGHTAFEDSFRFHPQTIGKKWNVLLENI